MQLAKLSEKLKPITIASGVFISGAFLYSMADPYTKISKPSSNKTWEYVTMMDSQDVSNYSKQFTFELLANEWKKETMFLSSPQSIIENKHFQSILSMGKEAVPYIINSLKSEPSTLVWALNIIYDKKISNNPNITIAEACKLWINSMKLS